MKKFLLSISVAMFIGVASFAQETIPLPKVDQKYWQHESLEESGVYGVNTQKAIQFLESKKRKPSQLIVGVLDSGVEVTHADLKDNVWINAKEIAGNGKDDDKNGYIDDVHGWNFIGGKDGKNVDGDTLELTRLFVKYKNLFETSTDAASNKTKYPEKFEEYQKIKVEFENKLAEAKQGAMQYQQMDEIFKVSFPVLISEWGEKDLDEKNMSTFQPKSKEAQQGMMIFAMVPKEAWDGKTMKEFLKKVGDEIAEGAKYYKEQVEINLNTELDPRPIVGDDYANVNERYYGNSDVDGPDSNHGTHVAGIIAAKSGNGIGIDGIAGQGNVKIMSVRTVPNGDERDKDVANAIRYATDNGAKILNMSFGKAYSPDVKAVWEAFKYAQDKGVLLIKAAGNDNENIDTNIHFPTVYNEAGTAISNNVITVGSNTSNKDELKSSFSNYGKKSVDVFAPGSDIYSAIPTRDGEYKSNSGTSMASPVVAGVAALVWSHYPKLTTQQVKQIILDSVNKNDQLKDISVTGGVVDAYKAVQLAEKIYTDKNLK
ncbi:S8 family serine peptidase [Empedobacter stercoris]|uniref:S8 family serine peptidase n=1 Tax=Empedobacter TaxID=59734 RepID=UPI0021B04954|nr:MULTISPECIES: S8 family serine peptidase [Empedobacter]MDM1524068.1 S8 family serine peptidase [Empedobacter sp. 225-1]MDM1544011.1 S8 family serine peptidase [Empedobacter sp. 189-2]UWX67283.1 S8 family serine peptidase [Empedobacter stercoris]